MRQTSSKLKFFPVLLATALGISLAGCASNHIVETLQGGACKAFDAPTVEIAGKTHYDQAWIDSQVEAGVGACHWPRPEVRPPELDATGKLPVKPPKKASLLKRMLRK